MKVKIRQAVVADAGEIARVHVLSWQKSYDGLIDADYLDQLKAEDRVVKWENVFNEIGHVVFVAELDNQLVGFVRGILKNDTYQSELKALYLLEEFQNQGIGMQLFQCLRSEFETLGAHSMNLWVLAENSKARKFYLKMGGQLGQAPRKYKIGEQEYDVVEYVWKKI